MISSNIVVESPRNQLQRIYKGGFNETRMSTGLHQLPSQDYRSEQPMIKDAYKGIISEKIFETYDSNRYGQLPILENTPMGGYINEQAFIRQKSMLSHRIKRLDRYKTMIKNR